MAKAFDPYHIWLGIPPGDQPPNYYRLLGVTTFEANVDVLESAADKHMSHLRSFQTGKHSAESQKLLNELAAARLCLLSPDKRQAYDRELKAKLAAEKPPVAPARPVAPPSPAPAAKPLAAQPLVVARPIAARPMAAKHAAPAAEPASALGFDPLEQTPARRPKKRSSNQSPAIYAGIGLGLIAVVAIAWIATGGGSDDRPIAAHDAKASSKAKDTGWTGEDTITPVRSAPKSPTTNRVADPAADPASDDTEPAAAAIDSDTPDEEPAGPSEPADDMADEMPVAESAGADDAGMIEPAADEPATDDRPAPPDADAIAAAVAEIQRVLHDDFAAAKKPAERIALAEKLIALVPDSSGTGEQYALLSEARRLAIAASSPALAFQAVDTLAESFAVDRFEQLAKTADELAARELSTAARKELVEAIEPLVEAALAAGQFAPGRRLAAVGLAAARKTNLNDIAKTLVRQGKKLAAGEKLAASAADARAQLAENPDDPKANETLGKYLCLYVHDWPAGLAHLAKADDPALRSVAELETAADPAPSAHAKLGDAWWALAEHAGADAARMRGRAGYWYEQAVSELTGLTKTRVEKRLKEIGDNHAVGVSLAGKNNGGVIADKLVIWNCNSHGGGDRGMLSCNVELRKAGNVVWSKMAVPLAWSNHEEPATTIPLPKVAFDALRVESASFQGISSALCEVEIFRGRTNLAFGKPATASANRDALFPASTVVDGIRDSSKLNVGYWVAPDRQNAWVEVQVAPPVDSGKPRAEKSHLKVKSGQPVEASGGVLADKLVVWNCNNNGHKNHGMLSCNIVLRNAGKAIWTKKAVPLAWSADDEPATTISLPKLAFDTVRLETGTFQESGPALCEIEVLRGDANLARGKPVTASGSYNVNEYPISALVDGIRDSSQQFRGYWVGPVRQLAWIEVQVAPPGTASDIPATPRLAVSAPSKPEGVIADKLVLWNCHNNIFKNQGMLSADIELRLGGSVVWSKKAVPLEWSRDAEPATTVVLPKIRFDSVRIESASHEGGGPALCEVQVFRGDTNLARSQPVTDSGSWAGRFPGTFVVDGITNSSQMGTGYWISDRSHAWVEVGVASPADLKKPATKDDSNAEGPNRSSEIPGPVTADKLVFWNCHNNAGQNLGMLSCNVELRKAGKIVWSKKAVPLAWSKDEEPATTIPLPKIAFETLRVETASYHDLGSALSEIEVFRGDTNIALGKPATANGSWENHFPAAVVDGIRDSSKLQVGYWAGPLHQMAWLEVQVAPRTVPDGKVVYLSDMPVAEAKTHSRFTLAHSRPVGGTESDHDIFTHPLDNTPAHVTYLLDREFKLLAGAVAIADSAEGGSATPLTFRVVGDGKELWRATLQKPGPPERLKLVVADVSKLELFVDCPGSSFRAHAMWVGMELTRGGNKSVNKPAKRQ